MKNEMSQMMKSYLQLKENYKDCIVFYRLGDFYEMFFDDAILVSRLLDLTLTGRNCGMEERAPMCGVPYHAVDTYLSKLIALGYKVAVCEQLNTPEEAGGKLVDRDVVRVITPGTVIEDTLLDEKKNNYLACIYSGKTDCAIAWIDISTGEFCTCQTVGSSIEGVEDILSMISPAEIICNGQAKNESEKFSDIRLGKLPRFNKYSEDEFKLSKAESMLNRHFDTSTLDGFGLKGKEASVCACGALMSYIYETQKRCLTHINTIRYVNNSSYMFMDAHTRANLEILQCARDNKRKASLLWVLDKTRTSMGGRLLYKILEQPLRDRVKIQKRLDSVEELISKVKESAALDEILKDVKDIERLTSKLSYVTMISPRDLLSLKQSLQAMPGLKANLSLYESELLRTLNSNIFALEDIANLLEISIEEKCPATTKDGGYIKEGFSSELDEYRNARTESSAWLADIETKEREATGIKNLKVGYNKVFGYYIEINKSASDRVPPYFVRKQTLLNNERYITEELKAIEDKVLGSSERAVKLEQDILREIITELTGRISLLQSTARNVAYLDVMLSFAKVAKENNYVKPTISRDLSTTIEDGRHPVVEQLMKKNEFVPNNAYLDCGQDRLMIITGPNMSGKSTYMRQIALITLMAHIGSFVPAKKADIALADRIFTRIGASDDLSYGQSTFMVEMVEVAEILHNATMNSLVIMDEIGRGTSTLDGLSIAVAVAEDIAKRIRCKTLFSTHYHEMTALEDRVEGAKNYKVTAAENKNTVIFLHKVMRGGANKSFGIEVAQLAGLPKSVTNRAKALSKQLEKSPLKLEDNSDEMNLITISENNTLRDRLKEIDMDVMTPMQAFGTLNELVDIAKKM